MLGRSIDFEQKVLSKNLEVKKHYKTGTIVSETRTVEDNIINETYGVEVYENNVPKVYTINAYQLMSDSDNKLILKIYVKKDYKIESVLEVYVYGNQDGEPHHYKSVFRDKSLVHKQGENLYNCLVESFGVFLDTELDKERLKDFCVGLLDDVYENVVYGYGIYVEAELSNGNRLYLV